ncbi:phospholipid transport system substrate-binding protein [Hydrocarboniphaga daqingensis]|uniref:Phospholipid transport system substrate-binding protein n=1 Tax=Hydrocarboniphaga daqingensis TaxID=490188 RepID=A0A1M5JY20_9GAMM|nr:ABC transporter substrate-binding protein [Hydrocarboniphaga daqingensis]SHG45497.1 phospholipid transport system substrate-binding protein [Hydrocarboniphaga daqingensis]
MKRFLSRSAATLAAALMALGTLVASNSALAVTPPDEVVRKASSELQSDISQNVEKYQKDKAAFYSMVDTRIQQYFDTPYIAQLILAQNWKTATADQRKRFEIAFKNMLIRSYADALLQYHDSVKAEVKAAQMASDATKATVNSSLMRKDGPPIPVAFDMRLKDDSWKVYDIKVENISLVTNFRSQVAAQVKATSIDEVITKLESGQQVVAPVRGSAS